jgi:hypothetical protein
LLELGRGLWAITRLKHELGIFLLFLIDAVYNKIT